MVLLSFGIMVPQPRMHKYDNLEDVDVIGTSELITNGRLFITRVLGRRVLGHRVLGLRVLGRRRTLGHRPLGLGSVSGVGLLFLVCFDVLLE